MLVWYLASTMQRSSEAIVQSLNRAITSLHNAHHPVQFAVRFFFYKIMPFPTSF